MWFKELLPMADARLEEALMYISRAQLAPYFVTVKFQPLRLGGVLSQSLVVEKFHPISLVLRERLFLKSAF